MTTQGPCTITINPTPEFAVGCDATGCGLAADFAVAIAEEGHDTERVAVCGPHLIVGQVAFIAEWVRS